MFSLSCDASYVEWGTVSLGRAYAYAFYTQNGVIFSRLLIFLILQPNSFLSYNYV